MIAKIPYDRNVNDALIAGKTVIEHGRGPAFEALRQIWQVLRKELLMKKDNISNSVTIVRFTISLWMAATFDS